MSRILSDHRTFLCYLSQKNFSLCFEKVIVIFAFMYCFRQTLVFIWNSAPRKKFSLYFWGDFCWCWQNFHFGRGTKLWAINLWSLEIFLIFPNFLRFIILVVGQLVRQAVHIMFITNNHASIHLWWKENLLNHQKISKYCEHDCNYLSKKCTWGAVLGWLIFNINHGLSTTLLNFGDSSRIWKQ